MVLALSVSSEIKTVGSYAGLAALLGLAILALLYFSQARETRRLSEWIEREQERRASAPAPVQVPTASVPAPGLPPPARAGGAITTAVPGVRRVAVPPTGLVPAASAAGVAAAAAVATAPEGAAAPQGAAETTRIVGIPIAAPATPAAAGLASPAAEAATELDPSQPAPVEQTETRAETALAAGPPVGEKPPASGALASESLVADSGPDTGEMDAADLPSGAAVPLVAQAPPSAEPRRVKWPPLATDEAPRASLAPEESQIADAPAEASPFAPSTPAGARPRFPPPPAAAVAGAVEVEATVRSAGAAAFGAPAAVAAPAPEPTRRREREAAPPQDEDGGNRSIASTLKLLLAAIVIVVALILIAEHVFGGSGKSTPPSSGQNTNSVSTGGGPAPSTVTVSVLNGTHTQHLATTAWAVLGKLGFRQGAIADAPVQDHRITYIGFTGANRRAAVEVARDLNVATVHVHDTIDQATLAAATATGHAPPAVVVILGANYRSG